MPRSTASYRNARYVEGGDWSAALGRTRSSGWRADPWTGDQFEATLSGTPVDTQCARFDALLVLDAHAHGHSRPVVLLPDDRGRARLRGAPVDFASHTHSCTLDFTVYTENANRVLGQPPDSPLEYVIGRRYLMRYAGPSDVPGRTSRKSRRNGQVLPGLNYQQQTPASESGGS
jgi:hypothetical protein